MLMMGKGTDCTELFESVHLFNKLPKNMLEKFYVRDNPNYQKKYTFEKEGFYQTIRFRVQEHFKNKAEKSGLKQNNPNWKTIIGHGTPEFFFRLIAVYTLLITTTYFAVFKANVIAAFLWGILAISVGGFGHEALHGGVFAKQWKNRLLALFTMDIFGISSYIYSYVHNTSHHIHPNIEKVDPDIEIHFPLLREFNYQKRRWFHRYQHYYAWIVYAVSLFFANLMDYDAVLRKRWGNLRILRPYPAEMFLFFLFKTLNIGIFFFLPFYLHGFGTAMTIVLIMLLMGGLTINVTFALNHQNEAVINLEKSDKLMDWGELQVITAYNYHHGNVIFDTLYAGLGYQIEHHLFPLLSYSQLPEIVPIVRKTCKEFNIPYHYYTSYWKALRGHYQFLKSMSQQQKLAVLEVEKA